MTANQITLIALLLIVACAAVVFYLKAGKARKNKPPKIHGPHTPGAGYDAKQAFKSSVSGEIGHDPW